MILLVYAIAIFLIIFKTANNYKGSRFWSFSSKALVTINLLFSINFFIEVSKFYFFEDYALEKEIESFKDKLPIQIDMNSTLIDIYKFYCEIVAFHTIVYLNRRIRLLA